MPRVIHATFLLPMYASADFACLAVTFFDESSLSRHFFIHEVTVTFRHHNEWRLIEQTDVVQKFHDICLHQVLYASGPYLTL